MPGFVKRRVLVLQQLVHLLAGSGVPQHHAQHQRPVVFNDGGRCHGHPDGAAIAFDQLQLAGARCARGHDLVAVSVVTVLVGAVDKPADRLVDDMNPTQAQQGGNGQIGLCDRALFTDGAVTHRGQVIEIKITRPGLVQPDLRGLQLFVLHLQFNLMDLQLMQRLPHQFRRQAVEIHGRQRRLSAHGLLSALTQFSAAGCMGRMSRMGYTICVARQQHLPCGFIRVLHFSPRCFLACWPVWPAPWWKWHTSGPRH